MDRRLPRRKLAIAIGALVLAVPGLSACGFNYATDREYTPGNGTNDLTGTVDVLNAVIVATEDGSGTFVASLSNNSVDEPISFDSLGFGSNSTIEVADFDPVEIKPHQAVNLADGQGIKVQGDFAKGDFLPLTVVFDNGESASMKVPVVDAIDAWEGMDNATGTPTESPTQTS